MTPTIACVVEGHGDVAAVPLLLRRLAAETEHYDLRIPRPVRCPKSKFIRKLDVNCQELERAISLATKKIPSRQHGAVLILIDADESCPAQTGPEILEAARGIRPDVLVGVALAKWEYEAWFVAAIPSLKSEGKLPASAEIHPNPEDLSDPKGYLRRQMTNAFGYSETVDQPAFTAVFDFAEADQCRSFRKLRKEVRKLLDHVYGGDQGSSSSRRRSNT